MAQHSCLHSSRCHNCSGDCWFNSAIVLLFGKPNAGDAHNTAMVDIVGKHPKVLFGDNLPLITSYNTDTCIPDFVQRKLKFYKDILMYYRTYITKILSNLDITTYKLVHKHHLRYFEDLIILTDNAISLRVFQDMAKGNDTVLFAMLLLENFLSVYVNSDCINVWKFTLKVKSSVTAIDEYIYDTFNYIDYPAFPTALMLSYYVSSAKKTPYNSVDNLYNWSVQEIPYSLLCCIVQIYDNVDQKKIEHSVTVLVCRNNVILYNSSATSQTVLPITETNKIPFYNKLHLGIPLETREINETSVINALTFVYIMLPNKYKSCYFNI